MSEVILKSDRVTVVDDLGDELTITDDHPDYDEARIAAINGDLEEYEAIVLGEEEDFDIPVPVAVMGMGIASSIPDMIRQIAEMTGIDLDEEDEDEDDDYDEHDLSQWSGSPIYYLTREMAREQADRWPQFWEYHDFGKNAPCGYRYATVPRLSMAPTAPPGYDWVCLPREES